MATTSSEAVIAAVVGALFGGAGLTGMVFIYMRRFIDKRLDGRERQSAKRRELRLRLITAEDEWYHAAGRLFFFLHKAVETGQHNGDLRSAFEKFQQAEAKKKEIDREIIAESELNL